ncbi:MAG: thioredoxin-disulfide reductase [Patescibacteria group bacterium]
MADDIRSVIIIGSGPAAFTAALYNARAQLKPLVLAGVKWGGQLMLTTDVENYPGFVEGILGPKLMENFRHQAERFGAQVLTADVTSVDFKKRPFTIGAGSKTFDAKAVIIATGAETNWLGLSNEQRLIGRGVSSCAPCDAFFFKDKKVIVVGGGDSAMEEALTLTKFASEVTIIHRREDFRASKIMIDRARANKKISFILNSVVVDVLGKDKVEAVKTKNVKDGSQKQIALDGMFVAIGHSPQTKIFKGQIELDEKGYVIRKANGERPIAFQMMTSVEGVFAAGDVHDYHYRQVATAAGYGCAAAMEAERWLESQD